MWMPNLKDDPRPPIETNASIATSMNINVQIFADRSEDKTVLYSPTSVVSYIWSTGLQYKDYRGLTNRQRF